MHLKFFLGILFPVTLMVALARIALNDFVVKSAWSIYTLIFGVGIAIAATILETTLKGKPVKKVGEK